MSWVHQVPKDVAEKVVQIIHEVTGNNVQFMGEGGEIIASTQPHRIGTIHEGARKVMAGELDYAAITEEMAKEMTGVLPGYTGPIVLDGKRIACIGITGDPQLVASLQKMAGIIVTDMIKKNCPIEKNKKLSIMFPQRLKKYPPPLKKYPPEPRK